MNKVLVTIAPAIDAFTRTYWPALRAARAIRSSVRLPRVALSKPPMVSPVRAATASVARLNSAASGMMASADSTKRNVCACGRIAAALKTSGTKISSQSSGVLRISLISGVTQRPRSPALENHSKITWDIARRKSPFQERQERFWLSCYRYRS